MKKYIILLLLVFLPFLLLAQKIDTVAEKISSLPYTKWEIYPRLTEGSIQKFVSENFKRPQNLPNDFEGNVIVSMLIDSSGRVRDIELIKNQLEIDQEVLRVLIQTKWKPAIYEYERVHCNIVLDIRVHHNIARNIFTVSTYPLFPSSPSFLNKGKDSSNYLYTTVDKEPSFPGGLKSFYEFLGKKIKYPSAAGQNNIQGTVYVAFVVKKDGTLTNIQIMSSPDDDLSLETIRVLKKSPKFNPGIKDGHPVNVSFNLPVDFSLKKGNY